MLNPQDRPTFAVPTAIILMALVVLIGWHAHIPLAVQIFPGLNQMQYNTALCFLALGIAGIGVARSRPSLMMAGGVVIAIMGAAVALEYGTGRNLGIDELFFHQWATLGGFPGRMAPTSAVSFLLIGSALITLAVRPRALGVFWMLNAVPLTLAVTSIVSYVFQITDVLPFGFGLQMALNTAVAFAAYGLAMLKYAWTRAARGPDGLPEWTAKIGVTFLPVVLMGAGALFPSGSWRVTVLELVASGAAVFVISLGLRRLSTVKVATKGLLMTAIPLLLLLTFVGLVVHVKAQNESAQALTQHSTEVLLASESFLARIAETESAVRAYIITGDETFATSSEHTMTLVKSEGAHLLTMVRDNLSQEARVRAIRQLATQRTDVLSELVRMMDSGNAQDADAAVKSGTGTALMTRLRAEMETFSREETRLGDERRHALATSWQRLSWLLVAGTTASLLLASILTLSFSGGVSRRLRQLQDNALSLEAGQELAPRLAGTDEIAELDRAFHHMADALDEVTRREKAVIEGTTDAIFVKNLEHRYLMMNGAGAAAMGVPVSDVIGATNDELIEAESARQIRVRDEEVIASGKTITFEYDSSNRAGVMRSYLSNRGPFRDRHGTIVGTFGISRDVTEQKRGEAALVESERRFREFFYDAPVGYHELDNAGVITCVNWTELAILGYSQDDMIGHSIFDFLENPTEARATFAEWLSGSMPPQTAEASIRRKNGTFVTTQVDFRVIHDANGHRAGIRATLQDITERKQAETLRQKNVELEAASRMKSEFLANMSHELRTPLNAIIGFSEILHDGLMGTLEDKQRGIINDIFSSGKHLLSLINDILDLSKVEAGKMTLDLEEVPLSSLFANGLSVIKEKAAARHIQVDLDLSAIGAFDSIQADPRKIKQILYNLLSNAVKFTDEGGRVTVQAGRVPRAGVGTPTGCWTDRSFPLADSTFGEFLEIRVKDNGMGIPIEALDRLFKPFSQVDSGLARRFEGTGLGLVMVKALVELHGGAVAVESAAGEGSCFTVWMPVRTVQEAELMRPRASAAVLDDPPAGVRTALVVEDDLKAAELIRLQLEGEGFTVLHAVSAEAALALVVQQPVSLITLDIMLPHMDGWDFLNRVKQVPDLRSIPVLIISIVADSNRGFALGAAAVMQKPTSRQDLYEALVDLGLIPIAEDKTLNVLVVDDDPKAVELIALRMIGVATTVLRAYGGREAINIARLELPDLIVLDLMMPEINGFDVVTALQLRPDTARIPILIVTAKQITETDRRTLNGFVTAIMEKDGFDGGRFVTEVRRAMAGRPAA